jgi:hypothetical protein
LSRTSVALVPSEDMAKQSIEPLEPLSISSALEKDKLQFNSKGATARMFRDKDSVRECLKDVRGRLVLFPHHFLHGEHLEPDIATRLLIGKNLFL